MDEHARRYLAAMGIDVWERRRPTAATDDDSRGTESPLPPTSIEASPLASEPVTVSHEPTPASPELPTAIAASMDWQTLQSAVSGCTACPLHRSRSNTVFGVGNRQADWMIIGEAPGAEEDRQGEPFVGRAGQLLNAMLESVGLSRGTVFIANTLKCRPPGNRDPQPAELACCHPYLARQIALVQPRLIVTVGRISAQNLLQSDTPVGKLRGRIHTLPGSEIPLVVTYHPAYLLRRPSEKRKAWADLKLARSVLRPMTQ
jgi:DNA polymerase